MSKPKVVITTWQVPFAQIVKGSYEFPDDASAIDFINAASEQWWNDNEGGRCCQEIPDTAPYVPISSLFDTAHYELWQGEVGFQTMLDEATYWRVHEEHYKRLYDDHGISRPGYLRQAMGEDVSAEVAEVHAFHSPKH